MSCTAAKETFTPVARRVNVVGSGDSVKFFTGNESAVQKYLVEFGKDSIHFTAVGAPILPGKKMYSVPISDSAGYIRIHASGVADFYTPAQARSIKNSVSITSPIYTSTSLRWTVSNEKNIYFFLIEKSINGLTWSKTTTVADKGNGTYTYRYARTTRRYQYRVTGVYNDLTNSLTSIFK